MSKDWLKVLIIILLFVGAFGWNRANLERTKRIELEAENKRITSIIDRVVNSSMTTRHTTADCYLYQGEISFLIAEYYGYQHIGSSEVTE